jgi:hypothetical protein
MDPKAAIYQRLGEILWVVGLPALAFWATLHFDLAGKILDLAPPWLATLLAAIIPPTADKNHVVAGVIGSVLNVALLGLFLGLLTLSRWVWDKKFAFAGRYLSSPAAHPDELNIFEISPAWLALKRYRLNGSVYSLKDNAKGPIGGWSSEFLDISPVNASEAAVRYMYMGKIWGGDRKGQESHGYTTITLSRDQTLTEGSWTDDKDSTPKSSQYKKLTRSARWSLLKDFSPGYRCLSWCYWPNSAIVDDYHKMPERQRPFSRTP